MERTFLKLNAKRIMMKNCAKCFVISMFPVISFAALTILNYCIFVLLNSTEINMYISPYAKYIRLSLITISSILSVFLWRTARLITDSYFLVKTLNKKLTFVKIVRCVSFNQCFTFFLTSIIRFLLSISWSAVYLSPCAAISVLLIYSYRFENNSFNINLTLFVSAVLLFVIGMSFLYITLKRYSMCSSVVLTEEEKNPFKIIEKSIEIMEGHSVQYALYCLSFSGWVLSCFLIIPLFYVVPYITIGKWYFKNSLGLFKVFKQEKKKPIIFYLPKKVEN